MGSCPLGGIFLIAGGGVTDKMRVPPAIGETYGRSGSDRSGSSGAVHWKSSSADQRHNDDAARSYWRPIRIAKVRELCDKAGFSSVRRVPLENPFSNLYEAKP